MEYIGYYNTERRHSSLGNISPAEFERRWRDEKRFEAVVRGMTDHRSNAYVEAMNGLLQQAKRAARGFRTSANFIAIAYLRLSKLKHLPDHPFTAPVAQ